MVDWAVSAAVVACTVTSLAEAADRETVKVALQTPFAHSLAVMLLMRSEGMGGVPAGSVMLPMAAQRSPKHWLVAASTTWVAKVWVPSMIESAQTVTVVVMVVAPAGKVRGRPATET